MSSWLEAVALDDILSNQAPEQRSEMKQNSDLSEFSMLRSRDPSECENQRSFYGEDLQPP